MRDRTRALVAGSLAAAAFLPAAAGGFVYDDHRFYEGNPHLGRASILWRAFVDPVCQTADGTEAGLWRPLRTLSFALDRVVFGASAVGPHVVNALLHGAGTALVFALLRRFGVSVTAAFVGAALYALHPAQVECAAWISSRGDLLAAALVWGALLLDLSGRARTAVCVGALALLAKEQAFVWPALAYIAARIAGDDMRGAARRALVPAIVVGVFLVARFALLAEPTQQGGLGGEPPRAFQMTAMLGHQAWFALVPVGSLFDWQMPRGVVPWGAAAAAAAALGAAFWRPTRLPVLWFLAALFPTLFLQAFVPLNILVADRFLMFALPALAFGAALVVDRVGAAPAVVAALCFATLTESAIPTWRSDDELWATTALRVRDHPRANDWIGVDAMHRGDVESALRFLRIAARGDPGGAEIRFHLASALEARGRATKDVAMLAEAGFEYRAAMTLFQNPRAEGRAAGLPLLAAVAAIDVVVLVGDDQLGATQAKALVAAPKPSIPEATRDAWDRRIESLAKSCELNPKLGPEFAKTVREWGRQP